MSLQINCVNAVCGKSLHIDPSLAGSAIRCPACAQVMVVPQDGIATPQLPVAQLAPPLRPATEIAPGLPPPRPLTSDDVEVIAIASPAEGAAKNCPKCQTAWPLECALCIQCGYDFRTGEKHSVVKSRKVRRTLRFNTLKAFAGTMVVIGGFFLFFGILGLLIGQRPLLALLCLLPSLVVVAVGIFLIIACQVKLRAFRHRDGYLVCDLRYLVGKSPYWRNEKFILPGDKFVIRHEMHPVGIIIMLFLLLLLIVPGIFWWLLLLKKRTMLTIENDVTGRRQGFSPVWDDEAIRELINAVQEVEHVEVVRR